MNFLKAENDCRFLISIAENGFESEEDEERFNKLKKDLNWRDLKDEKQNKRR